MAKEKAKQASVNDIKECPDCGSVNIKHNEEKQQVICLDCGLIYEPMAPEIEQQFEVTHESAPTTRVEVGELMPMAEPEKPVKKKAKPKAKPAKKAKASKPAKKAAPKAKAKKKPAKKAAKNAESKSGFASKLLKRITRVPKKRKGSFLF